ncbi:MAG: geranylgeranylglycerol-phosphate geranylgeranyltransferase [Flavobacteriales bacterium]|nr:geranylgeranylglycerol-phosphate geranylgeranyltransferase [Flavobacteriales bacterium]
MAFSKKQKYLFVKFLALFTLVRWYNILLITFALYLSAVFLINPRENWLEVSLSYKLHLTIASLAFFIMAGYIINAFYDFEKDIINRPKETIFDRVISKASCLRAYGIFILIGFVLSLVVGWKVLVFNTIFSFSLWFYSHKLRKKPITGELGATLLTIAPFISLTIFYLETNLTIILYIGYLFAVTLTREIIKKMVYLKGDLIVGEKSLPIIMGIRKTKYIILGSMLFSLIPVGVLFPEIVNRYILYYFIISSSLITTSILLLKFAKTPSHFDKINTLYKVIILMGILSIPLI